MEIHRDSEPVEVLSTASCWELLRTVPVGRFAVRNGDDVEIFPVNFVVDHGTIVFRTAGGTKLELVGRDTRSAFEADEFDLDERTAWSVVLKGACRPVAGHDAIIDSFGVDVVPWQAGPKPTFVRLEPDQVTGRRFVISPDV